MNTLAQLGSSIGRRWLPRLLLLATLSLGLLGWQQHAAPRAAAAGWSVNSGTQCDTGGITGFSTLNWDGYALTSSGYSWSTLWEWDNGNWLVRSQANNSAGGYSGSATAQEYTGYGPGSYYTSGSHSSTFFSGYAYSNSAVYSC